MAWLQLRSSGGRGGSHTLYHQCMNACMNGWLVLWCIKLETSDIATVDLPFTSARESTENYPLNVQFLSTLSFLAATPQQWQLAGLEHLRARFMKRKERVGPETGRRLSEYMWWSKVMQVKKSFFIQLLNQVKLDRAEIWILLYRLTTSTPFTHTSTDTSLAPFFAAFQA